MNANVIIIGAGAAGLMCAIEAGKRGRKVIIVDHANKPGKKILMSGGGRCNFTNYHIHPDKYLSHNPHFCKSALNLLEYPYVLANEAIARGIEPACDCKVDDRGVDQYQYQ